MKRANKGIAVGIAGRTVHLWADGPLSARLSSRSLKVIPGDLVLFDDSQAEASISEVMPRRNLLMRTFAYRDRDIAANLDRLLVVTAGGVLFNTIAIDRLLAVASAEGIPVSIIINKLDLGREEQAQVYSSLGYSVLELSAKTGEGFEDFLALLCADDVSVVALCGVSGVGKSSILNRLIPDAASRTGEVSMKTGQGRQTTSQARGYLYQHGAGSLVLIDLPGSQAIGVSHLSRELIRASFPEFSRHAEACEYVDCLHIAEPLCGVKSAVEEDRIALSRYRSYLNMCQEIADMPAFRKYGYKKA